MGLWHSFMRKIISSSILASCLLCSLAFAEVRIEKIGTGFRFTEGPAVHPDGTVYFTDIPTNKIHRWSEQNGSELFRDNSGGANGLSFKESSLYICEGKNRQLTVLSPDGDYTVLAHSYEGKPLNSPNDLWITPTDGIYFTDPRYGRNKQIDQDGEHVYYLSKNGELTLAARNLVRPNGIIGTPDGKTLYVADHGGDIIYRYPILESALLGEREVFAEQGSDGMALDASGRLYLTDAALDIYNPDGTLWQSIPLPEKPANVAILKETPLTLFVTATTSIYKITLD